MGQVIDFRTRKRIRAEKTLEQMACELMDVVWRPWFIAPTVQADTAPCEYVAPDRDPA